MSKIRACTICSGSSANAIYIEIDNEAILIDAGCTVKALGEFLKSINSSFERIKAVFVTHEHSDHIKGVGMLSQRNIPIIANKVTLENIKIQRPEADISLFREMPTGFIAKSGNFSVMSFRTSHDSAESVGYIVDTERGKIGVFTDLGFYDKKIAALAGECRLIFVEANHDENMLWKGRYPYPLKRRISGLTGHLSNEQCGRLLEESRSETVEYVVLIHLSKENNTPEIAAKTVSSYLSKETKVIVAPRGEKSEFINL